MAMSEAPDAVPPAPAAAAPARLHRGLVALAVVLCILVVANVALGAYLWGYVRALHALRAAPTPPGAEARMPLPRETTGALRQDEGRLEVGRSDRTNDFVVTVDAIEFRRTGTRLWLSVENRRTEPVQFMAGATATLLDEQGRVYRVDPFKGSHPFWGPVPAGGKESGWLEFPPVPEGVRMLRLVIPDVFSLGTPPWTVEIEFSVGTAARGGG